MTKQFKQVISLHYLGPIKSFERAKTKVKMSKFDVQRQSLGSHRNVATRCNNYAETGMRFDEQQQELTSIGWTKFYRISHKKKAI